MPRVCGRLGPGDSSRAAAMAELLAKIAPASTIEPVFDRPGASVWACDGARLTEAGLLAWAPAPLPEKMPQDQSGIATEHDASVVDPAEPSLHSGISGAAPVYVDDDGGSLHFCTRVEPLAQTRSARPTPDWDGWAQVIAMGAPLASRTTFAEIRRLPPWTRVIPGDEVAGIPPSRWPWLAIPSSATASIDAVRDALEGVLAQHTRQAPLASLLTGGWDSRVLATLATGNGLDSTWTTSSDHGHALEELVARRVANELGVEHKVVAARWDRFGAELADYAQMVDFQSSFHVWLVALAESVATRGATVLDGLGGGLFVGGDFPDPPGRTPPVERRFQRLAHYLDDASLVLDTRAAAQVAARTRASFRALAEPLADHPFGASFTAYLSRTVPGISYSPYGVIGSRTSAATPFLADPVVRAALAIPPEQHKGGQLYPELIRPVAPTVATLDTAAAIAPNYRRHHRRIASDVGAAAIRDLTLREPVRSLLQPALATADLQQWQRLLNRTAAQHLLRGLAMLALWLDHYGELLGPVSPDELREVVG